MRFETLLIVTSMFGASAHAQWLNYPDRHTPRTRDGKPNLSAPAPRLNGKPDLSGVWQAERTPMSEFVRALGNDPAKLQVDIEDGTKHMINVFWDVKPEEAPIRDEAKSVIQHRMQNPQEFPQTHCLPLSVPMAMFVQVFKMVHASQEIAILFEAGDPPRQIYTDGRGLPKDPQPSWMGYSAGKWEGDTLVVETIGFNASGWLDFFGHPRSESMRITERYRRRDLGHMDFEMTIEDPKYYTRPFSIKTGLNLVADSDILEYVCNENEKDRVHLDTR